MGKGLPLGSVLFDFLHERAPSHGKNALLQGVLVSPLAFEQEASVTYKHE